MSKLTLSRKQKRLIRLVVAGGLGYALGKLCEILPASHQFFCHLAAKILAVLGGS